MAWTKNGTVAATNGQVAVTGTGTSFIANKVQPGDAILLADGRFYEIAGVASDTALTLAVPYAGGTASGMGYAILPTNNRVGELAGLAAELLNGFATVRDTVGLGMFPDGTVSVPGWRFLNDQDTGIFRPTANQLGIAAGGVSRLTVRSAGVRITGNLETPPESRIGYAPDTEITVLEGVTVPQYGMMYAVALGAGNAKSLLSGYGGVLLITEGKERARIDQAGNLLVGTTSGNTHTFQKGSNQGDGQLNVYASALFFAGSGAFGSGSATAISVCTNTTTGRSINAGGTINASGADYAEYMRKADGCSVIAKGGVCGVDAGGKLTKTWADAVSFVVKSTDPSLVGGDVWGANLPPRPDAPTPPAPPTPPTTPPNAGAEPVQPARNEGEDDESFVARLGEFFAASAVYAEQVAAAEAHTQALEAYQQQLATYQAAHAQWQADQAQYETDLADWEAALEAARQCVDRIAFSGQVPCNVTGDFAVGDYIVAAANGGGIKAIAVPEADMTLPLYMKRLGKVWAITDDGRAWIDVQHG